MKKIIIILSILFTLVLSGVLYGKNKQPDWVKIVTAEQVYMHQFPDSMPNVMIDPMVGFSLY